MYHRKIRQQAAQQTPEQELQAQADALLRAYAEPNVTAEYPLYISDSSLRQASTREQALSEHGFFEWSSARPAWTPLLEALCSRADLTTSQCEILELTRQGHSKADIAQRLNLTVKAVGRRQERIIARLRHAARIAGDRLLMGAYEEQLEQHRYQPEQHCAPGREACRRDGKCRYRWYLYTIVAEQQAQ
jgi:hypothetical protein